MELKTILLPTLNASPAKRGDLLINGIGELVIVDYDDSVACGVDLFLCSTLNVKNGDWAFDLVYKRIVKIKSVKDNFVALDVEEGLTHSNISNLRKIEFTTDPKLIADGVLKIDGNTIAQVNSKRDEAYFLAEFCKRYNQNDNQKVDVYNALRLAYQIIIDNNCQLEKRSLNIIEQALQSNAGGFSLEDCMNALHKAELKHDKDYTKIWEIMKTHLQSLTKESQSKEDIVIECEMDDIPDLQSYKEDSKACANVSVIKLNKDGQPILTFK